MQQQLNDSITSSQLSEENQNQQEWEDVQLSSKRSINSKVLAIWNKLQKQPGKITVVSFKLPQKRTEKSVCAKTISKNQTIVQCYDCRTDPTCIMCLDCFKNSNHEGHKYVIKTAFGGCCDCGDSEAWKQQGFCTKHSGKSEDVQIPQEQINRFVQIFTDVFILYFEKFLKAKKQKSSMTTVNSFLKGVLSELLKLNTDSAYYNKLTTMVFTKIIKKQQYPLQKDYNSVPILANLLRFNNNQTSQLILKLCYAMFPYYSFKQVILSYYFKYYSFIYNGTEDSNNSGSSYSCQLISSYQLVSDYCEGPNAVQLGFNINLNKLSVNKIDNLSIIILHDLQYIRRLQGSAPLKYWKMNIERGIDNLFIYYEKIIMNLKKILQENNNVLESFTNNVFINSFQIQAKLIQLITDTLPIIKQNQQILFEFLKKLYLKIVQQNQRNLGLIIFKPYQRVFSLVLFTFLGMDLNNINPDFLKQLAQKFGSPFTQDHLKKHFSILLKRFANMYLFYNKIYSHPGLLSTFYPFIYFYSKKNKLIMSLDIMTIKMITLCLNQPPVFKFSQFIQMEDNENSKANLSLFISLLKSLNKLYASSAYESYIASSIDQNCTIYRKQFEQVFLKALKQKRYEINKSELGQIEHLFFPPKKTEYSEALVKQFCNFSKESKKFVLKQQFRSQKNIGINFQDFKTELINNQGFQGPQKTSALIDGYNRHVAQLVWSEQSIKKAILIFHHYHSKFLEEQLQVQKISLELYRHTINAFAHQYIILIQLKLKNYPYPALIKQNLLNMESIKLHIDPNYHEQLGMKKASDSNDNEQQRKLKLKAIKQAKMLEIKNKQKKIFQKMTLQQQRQDNQEEINDQISCCVCKQQSKENLVYLVDLKLTNHDKLLGLNTNGTGIQCLSFKSCYHIFDHECIKKITKQKNHCPLCRQHCDVLIPYEGKHSQAKQLLQKIRVIMFKHKDYDQIDIVEQILKSFYHLVLLGIIDLEYTIKKRVPLYAHLLDFIKLSCKKKQLLTLLNKNMKNQITLIPKVLKQPIKVEKQNKITAFFQALLAGGATQNIQFNQLDIEDLNSQEQMNSEIIIQEGIASDEEGVSENKKKKIKKPKKNKKSEEEQKNTEKIEKIEKMEIQDEQVNLLFRATIEEVLTQILHQKKLQKKLAEKIKNQHHKKILEILLAALRTKQHHEHFLKQIQQNGKFNFKLRQMPLKYSPLAKYQTCHECQQLSASLHLCLICENWVGCQQCHNSQKNIVTHNYLHHGQVGVFINLRTTQVIFVAGNIATEAGKLYKDEFCQPFDIRKSWQNYNLDEAFLQEIKIKLIHDDIQVSKKSKII